MELGGCHQWRALYALIDNFPNQEKVVHILCTVARSQVLQTHFYESDLTKVQYFVNDLHKRTFTGGHCTMVTSAMTLSHYFNITFHKNCSAVAILILWVEILE